MNKESSTAKHIDAALEETGIGKFHAWIVITGGLMLYTVNSESWSIGYVITSAECEMDLNLNEKTILVTIGSVGMMSTQFFWGFLSDKIGRRSVLLHTLLLACLCNIFSVLVPTFWLLATFRFMNGAFIACASGLSFAYVSEFFSSRYRSVAILIMSTFIGIALIIIPLCAWLIIPMEFPWSIFGLHLTSWRIYILMSGLPALLSSLAVYFCPESPKYLVQAKLYEEALNVLQKIHKLNNNKTVFSVGKVLCDESVSRDVHIWKLFCMKYIWKTLLVCTLQGGVFATSCGLFLWYPDILQQISLSTEDITVCQALHIRTLAATTDNATITETNCNITLDNSVYLQNIFIGVAYTIGYIVISALVNKVGVRNILICFLGIAGLATFSLYVVMKQQVINVIFILLLAFSGICAVVVNTAVVEIYPTHMRGMAVCIVMLSGRLGSILASSSVGYLLLWNCEVTFMLFGASLIGCSVLSIVLSLYLPNTH